MQLFDQVWRKEGAVLVLGRSPLLIAFPVLILQSQDCLGAHRICFTFSWDIVLPRELKSSRLHSLFRALHAYLCLIRWQIRSNLPPPPSVALRCPRATRQSDGWFRCWKCGMKITRAILAGKFLWTCQHYQWSVALLLKGHRKGCLGCIQSPQYQCYNGIKKWNLSPLICWEHWCSPVWSPWQMALQLVVIY